MTRQAELAYHLLMARAGQTVFYEEIVSFIGSKATKPRLICWVLICNIRDHLGPGQEIIPIYGKGYRLCIRESASRETHP